MMFGKFNVEDIVWQQMKANGESAKPCDLCGKYLLAVRDIRKPAYCINCQPKATKLKRYQNADHPPGEQEKEYIVNNMIRGGR